MVKTSLVGLDIEAGARAILALDDAGISVKVALWMSTEEYEEGRLVIASPALDQAQPMRAYRQVAEVLHDENTDSLPSILILKMRDPFVQELRQLFGNTEACEGMRLGGQTVGNRFILDAFVYRIQ